MNSLSEKKTELITLIRSEIEQTFGRRVVSAGDCIQLSEEIYFKTSSRINSNTLRRFFGLVKAPFLPSAATLNILAKYCGFESIDDIYSVKIEKKETALVSDNGVLNYLISIFRSTRVKDENDETFFSLVKQTIQYIQNYPSLADKFQRAIAKTKNGQEYYFEQFVNIDKLNSFYGDGLRYYMAEKKTNYAQIFGHSVLCLRYWLTSEKEYPKKNYESLIAFKVQPSLHPVILGRYFASLLFYNDKFHVDQERLSIDVRNIYSVLQPTSDKYRNIPCFELFISQALMYTKQFSEALFYLDQALAKYFNKAKGENSIHKELLLLKACCLAGMEKKKESEMILQNISPTHFSFLNKKLNTLLFLMLSKDLNRSKSKNEDQIQTLLDDTGFVSLKSLF